MRVRGSRASRHRGAKLKAAVEQAKEARHHEMRQLHRALLKANTENDTLCRLLDEAVRLHDGTRKLRDQKDRIRSLSDDAGRLRHALKAAEAAKERLKARLLRATEAARSLSPRAEDAQLRKFLRRSRRQKTTINELSRENARLRRTAKVSRNRLETLEAQLAKLHATRAVLSKALFGRKSEKQETPRSGRRRGQQRGAPGHGRSQRPGLEERTEVQNPPVDARACSCCGRRYAATGAEQSTLVEIEIRAHKRVIRRPRWRRTCDCASSPVEVSAPPLPRLFANTPYGTSVWSRFLFERYACLRPLQRVAAWMSDQGLPLSPGTLADSVPRFVPLFEPLADASLAHQNTATLRHADETTWRVQALRDAGRSSRAWLWISISGDAAYFHIDASRSAEAAQKLFAEAMAAHGHRLRPLQRLQEAGTPSRGAGHPGLVLGPSTARLYQVRGRPGSADGMVPGMARAERVDLPPQRGAADPLRPRSQEPAPGIRRGAGRARRGARQPVRGCRTGTGGPAGSGARGQGAALAGESSQRAERLRRPAPGSARQQSRRATVEGADNREAPVVRLRQRDRRPVHGADVLGDRHPDVAWHRRPALAQGMADGVRGERRPPARRPVALAAMGEERRRDLTVPG